MLTGTLIFGFLFCQVLRPLAEIEWVKWAIVIVTMFAMAWPLQFGALTQSVLKPLPAVLGSAINFIVVPLLAWPASKFIGPDLGIGLLVACSVPTTLATGPVWTRRAGGDDNVAMVVTIFTNGACFLVTPALVFALTGSDIPDELFAPTVWKLLFFVVIPIVVAQLLRLEAQSAEWVTRKKPMFGKIAQAGVLCMTTLGAVQTGLKMESSEAALFGWTEFIGMVCLVVVIHMLALYFGKWLAKSVGLPPDKQIAVAISGSQKTMMVGLSIAISLGVSILPMVAYHALQLILDTVVVDRHRKQNESHVQTEKTTS